MAHSLSAKKRVRQSIKRRASNRHRKELIKDGVKSYTAAVASGTLDKAATLLKVPARLALHESLSAIRVPVLE